MVRTGSAAVWADQIFSWNDTLPTFLSHRAGPSPEKSPHFQDPILRTRGRSSTANRTIFRPDPLHAHTLGRIQAALRAEKAVGVFIAHEAPPGGGGASSDFYPGKVGSIHKFPTVLVAAPALWRLKFHPFLTSHSYLLQSSTLSSHAQRHLLCPSTRSGCSAKV